MQGQEISPVPSDPAVKSGQLPNGMKWYVAVNPDTQGTADFALVQMTGAKTIPGVGRGVITEIAQSALLSQPLLTAPTVQDFFMGKGCIPGPEGFAEVSDNATVFRFANLNLKLSDSVLDSTLLVLMNMAGQSCRSDNPLVREWFAPADQAIIVAGDVKADAVAEKLRMLSYMIPAGESVPRSGYVWAEKQGVRTVLSRSEETGLARVSAVWRLERTPKELMNTIQPVIQEKYMTMTGLIACKRIRSHFRDLDIPVASVESRYSGGAGTLGDGEFEVEVALASDRAEDAVSALAGVLSSIDAYGVTPAEAEIAALEYAEMISSEGVRRYVGNRQYINRCVSAFIYNTALSSRRDVVKLCLSKELSPDTERTLLSSVASPVLDDRRNISLKYSSDSMNLTEDAFRSVFSAAWKKASETKPAGSGISQVPHLPVPETKVRIRSVKKEYLSGGSVWTLSNGMKIIVKNMPSEDYTVHYSLSLNGGTGNVEGLGVDDGGYLADYLELSRVGGACGRTFKDVILRRGMSLSCQVGHSSTKLTGVVPADGLDYMLRAFLALMNHREPDSQEWEYYLKGETLRQVAGTSSGNGLCLTGGFASKADEFFRTLSANMNNGVLILVGNIDDKMLKNALVTYAGGFRTTDKTFTRTQTQSRNFTGTEGYRRQGGQRSVNVSLTAPLTLTAENYYTAAIASMVLRRHFALSLAGRGMRVSVGYECRRFPQESVLMRVSVSEASSDGLASGTSDYNMTEAFGIMRKVFAELPSIDVEENVLASYRYRLERQLAREKASPEYWIDALNLRYIGGKDFTTDAEAKIKGVTADNVKTLLAVLGGSSKIEYVITGK